MFLAALSRKIESILGKDIPVYLPKTMCCLSQFDPDIGINGNGEGELTIASPQDNSSGQEIATIGVAILKAGKQAMAET